MYSFLLYILQIYTTTEICFSLIKVSLTKGSSTLPRSTLYLPRSLVSNNQHFFGSLNRHIYLTRESHPFRYSYINMFAQNMTIAQLIAGYSPFLGTVYRVCFTNNILHACFEYYQIIASDLRLRSIDILTQTECIPVLSDTIKFVKWLRLRENE